MALNFYGGAKGFLPPPVSVEKPLNKSEAARYKKTKKKPLERSLSEGVRQDLKKMGEDAIEDSPKYLERVKRERAAAAAEKTKKPSQ